MDDKDFIELMEYFDLNDSYLEWLKLWKGDELSEEEIEKMYQTQCEINSHIQDSGEE